MGWVGVGLRGYVHGFLIGLIRLAVPHVDRRTAAFT